MSAFTDAIDAVFADPNVAVDADWTTQGVTASVRVLRSSPDVENRFGDARFVVDSATFRVRISEIAEPKPGDTITIGGDTYRVQGAPVRDRLRLMWTVEANPT